MERALRTLLDGVIDYAGLFPPARLEMEPSVEQFLGYRLSPNNWLVSRFACPAGRLTELAAELEKHPLTETVPIAVIGTSGKDRHHWDTALAHDLSMITKFREMTGISASIEAFEIRLPDNHHTESCLQAINHFGYEEVFVEIPWSDGMEEAIACIAESGFAFAKARTGGLEPSAFPSAEELAAFIQQCAQLDVPFKLTAGLHEPLAHTDSKTGCAHHGFLNVLVAATFATGHDLSRREIEQILNVKDGKAFSFTQESLKWQSFTASLDELEAGRELLRSFGSCSVEEPLAGLEQSGFMRVHA